MDWSATHCRPIAQQSAQIIKARARQRTTLMSLASDCPHVNPTSPRGDLVFQTGGYASRRQDNLLRFPVETTNSGYSVQTFCLRRLLVVYMPNRVYRLQMTFRDLQNALEANPNRFPRFVLPDGDYIPAHAHVTEVGHLVRNFIDCGGLGGKEEKVVLQTHVGNDEDHRLRADRFSKILQLGMRVLPSADLDVDVEYDCCVVAQYPIVEVRREGEYLNLLLQRGRTQCRARERREANTEETYCAAAEVCC